MGITDFYKATRTSSSEKRSDVNTDNLSNYETSGDELKQVFN